ncbi:MAG: hypothetical protein ABIJ10_03845 [Candidatus Micrarchaeota archaeon]|nr:hypothetical protein [Candidatus Micrarchaeota archaeon]
MDLFQIAKTIIDPVYVGAFVFFVCAIAIVAQLFILVFWKKTNGFVLKSYIEGKENRKRKRGTKYRAVIEYKYHYGGNEYSGKSGWIMNEYHSFKELMQKVLQFDLKSSHFIGY